MSVIFPNIGKRRFLDRVLVNAVNNPDIHLRLFKASYDGLNADTVDGDLTEADYEGYSVQTITNSAWSTPAIVGTNARTISPEMTFTRGSGGTSNTVLGWYATIGSTDDILCGEFFDSPHAFDEAGDEKRVTVEINTDDCFNGYLGEGVVVMEGLVFLLQMFKNTEDADYSLVQFQNDHNPQFDDTWLYDYVVCDYSGYAAAACTFGLAADESGIQISHGNVVAFNYDGGDPQNTVYGHALIDTATNTLIAAYRYVDEYVLVDEVAQQITARAHMACCPG